MLETRTHNTFGMMQVLICDADDGSDNSKVLLRCISVIENL